MTEPGQDKDAEIERLLNLCASKEEKGSYNKGFKRGAGFVFMLAVMVLLLIVFSK